MFGVATVGPPSPVTSDPPVPSARLPLASVKLLAAALVHFGSVGSLLVGAQLFCQNDPCVPQVGASVTGLWLTLDAASDT